MQFTLPFLLVSSSHEGVLLPFLSSKCSKLRFATSARAALSILETYPARILVCDLSVSETETLSSGVKDKDLLRFVLIPENTPLKSLENIKMDSWLIQPYSLKTLLDSLVELEKNALYLQSLRHGTHLAEQFEHALEASAIVSKTDTKGFITYANRSFEEISGYTKDELIGKPHNIVRHPKMPKKIFKVLWETILDGQIWKGIIKNRKKDGTSYIVQSTIVPILNRDGVPIEFIGIRHDITQMTSQNLYLKDVAKKNEELIKAKSDALLEKLYKDEITNLPNTLSLQKSISNFQDGTIFLFDINNFNTFNKLYGFAFGDSLLREVSRNMEFLFGDENVFKLSADRFAVLVSDYNLNEIESSCNQVFAFFDNTHMLVEDIDVLINFSIGVAQIKAGHDSIIDAEFALDLAKRQGKRSKAIYDDTSSKIKEELSNIAWLNRTKEYIYRDLIVPYYQPIVDTQTRKIYKYECLARVIDGEAVVPPLLFIGAAARLGLLTSVTKSMINKSFQYFSQKDVKFSINITERDILDGYLVNFIKMKADRYKIDLNNVTFEILENLTISKESDLVNQTIAQIKEFGCDIAIDDFGSEKSNFSRILSLRSDFIKIDGAFVRDCDKDFEKQKIIDAIVQLAKRLGIKSIAEFVSTEEIFETVKRLGVDYVQGYLFGKPEPTTICEKP